MGTGHAIGGVAIGRDASPANGRVLVPERFRSNKTNGLPPGTYLRQKLCLETISKEISGENGKNYGNVADKLSHAREIALKLAVRTHGAVILSLMADIEVLCGNNAQALADYKQALECLKDNGKVRLTDTYIGIVEKISRMGFGIEAVEEAIWLSRRVTGINTSNRLGLILGKEKDAVSLYKIKERKKRAKEIEANRISFQATKKEKWLLASALGPEGENLIREQVAFAISQEPCSQSGRLLEVCLGMAFSKLRNGSGREDVEIVANALVEHYKRMKMAGAKARNLLVLATNLADKREFELAERVNNLAKEFLSGINYPQQNQKIKKGICALGRELERQKALGGMGIIRKKNTGLENSHNAAKDTGFGSQ